LSRDFAMVLPPRLSPASRYCTRDFAGCLANFYAGSSASTRTSRQLTRESPKALRS
jgi:hypothetical protein